MATHYTTSRNIKSIQMISVVTFVSSLLNSSLQPLERKNLIYILVPWSQPFMKLFYSTSQLEMLYCGSGRDRTYSALRQQIVIGGVYDTPTLPTYFQSAIYDSLLCYYSLSRLSNCGADPFFFL